MTEIDTSTAAVEALLDGVRRGPWFTMPTRDSVYDARGYEVASYVEPNDREFIAASRSLVPALLAERDALAAQLAQAKAKEAQLLNLVTAAKAFAYFDALPTFAKRPDVFEKLVRQPLLLSLAELELGPDANPPVTDRKKEPLGGVE